MLAIRPVRPEDAPAVLALLHAAHAWNLANGFNFTAADITAEDLAPRLTPAHFFVAEQAGKLVGTIEVKPEKQGPDWGFHLLAVDPETKGGGVGRALVAFAEDLGRRMGAPRLILDTPETHPWLPAFYARLGYEPFRTDQWAGKRYRSVLMAKRL
ncbi:MAG: putative N-acetyltransferase [Cyanobacteria bacterium RYN_339]|nr:putative N-acetyltransferase [Cyanobacteria bacterium RYN_339]